MPTWIGPSTVVYVGGNVAFATTWNNYGDFPGFSSSGPGGGGQAGARYYFQPNVFAGFEAGWIGTGIRGTNPDGAFVNYDWQAWQMGQLGVTWTPQPFTSPVTVYGGIGLTEGGIRVGVDFGSFHEDMNTTMTGLVLRTGFEINVRPNLAIGAAYQYSRFDGTVDEYPVKTQINTLFLTFNYTFGPRF